MAQQIVKGDGTTVSLTASDTAVARKGDVEQHGLTVTAAVAATVTITDNEAGWLVVTPNAAVTVKLAK